MFFFPPEPSLNFPGENIVLSGDTHVVTQAYPPEPFNVYMNMASVQGIGQVTGNLYLGTGAAQSRGVPWPPEPLLGTSVDATFSLQPTNGLASMPLSLTFDLIFASNGTLLPASSVAIFQPK